MLSAINILVQSKKEKDNINCKKKSKKSRRGKETNYKCQSSKNIINFI